MKLQTKKQLRDNIRKAYLLEDISSSNRGTKRELMQIENVIILEILYDTAGDYATYSKTVHQIVEVLPHK